ncbi:Ig-like domain-containing protein [Vibrio sp. WJH972]
MSLQLRVIRDNQTSYWPLDVSLSYGVESGAIYTLVDELGVAVTDGIELIRKDDDLELVRYGDIAAEIVGFYSDTDIAAFYWVEGGELPVDPSSEVAGTFISNHDFDIEQGLVWSFEAGNTSGNSNFVTMGVVALLGGAVASGSSSSSSSGTTNLETAGYDINLTAAAGTFISTVGVKVYDESGNLLYSDNCDLSASTASLTIDSNYVGPILVVISDNNGASGDYIDETTNTSTSLKTSLSAMTVADGNDVRVSVTPLTELAVRKAGIESSNVSSLSLTTADVAINDQIGELFGIDDITGEVVTVLDDDYNTGDGTSNAEIYGEVLAALSGADSLTINGIGDTLDSLEAKITTDSSGVTMSADGVSVVTQGVDAYETAISEVLSSTVLAVPIIEAASGGVSASEASAGVEVIAAWAVIGDSVTIRWGSEQYIGIANLNSNGDVVVTVPESTIIAAGEGEISVTSQISGADESPAIMIEVDITAPTVGSISATDDVGLQVGALVSSDTTDDSGLVLSGTGESGNTITLYNSLSQLTMVTVADNGTWNYTAAVADATNYSFTYTETDTVGNISAASGPFEVTGDMTAPVSPTIDTTQGTVDYLEGTAEPDSVVTVSFTKDSTNYSYTTTADGSGDWSLDVTSADNNGATPELVSGNGLSVMLNSIDSAGNTTTSTANTTVSITDTSVVVFDLTTGLSSDHSSRTFDTATSYTIYIMVSSESEVVNLNGSEKWQQAGNLSSDDTFVIVGDGSAILGDEGLPATGWSMSSWTTSSTLFWYLGSGGGMALALFSAGNVSRDYNYQTESVDLWTGTISVPGFSNINKSYVTTLPSSVSVPA